MDETHTRSIEWRAVVGATPGGVAVVVHGQFAHVSPEFADAVGATAAALVGEHWAGPFTDRARTRLDRDAIPRAREGGRWQGTVAVRSGEWGGPGRDRSPGADRRIGLTVSATDAGSLVWVASPDEAAEDGGGDEDPRRRLDCHETPVGTAVDGVYALNEDLEFAYVDDGLCDVVGRSREELLGRPASAFVEGEDEAAMDRETRRRAVEGDTGWESVRATVDTPSGRRVLETRYRLSPDPDGEFRGGVGVVREVTERERRERGPERQRTSLATMDRVNELLLETARELVQTASREAVERTVCGRLAASDLYRFVWVGRRALDGDRVDARAAAGDGAGYLDAVTVTADGNDAGTGPPGRALRTGEVQADAVDDDPFEPWAAAARERGFASVAAVPLRHGQTVYGVVAAYTERESAFTERERAGLDVIGRIGGEIIHAARSRDLLFADAVVELEFDCTGADAPLIATARDLGCEFALEGYVAAGERWLLYVSMAGGDPSTAVETVASAEGVESARVLEADDGVRIEVVATSSSLLHAVTGVGANLRTVVAGPDEARVVVEAPATVDTRAIVEEVGRTYEAAVLVAHRERDRSASSIGRPEDLLSSLTDRQRETLEAAYRAGYFDWPRESTAEEVAEMLDLSGPTLHGHLRKAQAHIISALIDGA